MIRIILGFFNYRFLTYMMALRDLKLRYNQTILGVIWVVLQPLFPVIIFTFVFGKVVNIDSHGIPYLLFAFSGLVPWLFFSDSVSRCSTSLVAEERLLTKVYFPKLILPFSKFITVFIDFVISFTLFIVFLFFYDIHFSCRLFFLPIVLIDLAILSLSLGIILSALNVYYRDFKIITPFILQIAMYASPVIYSSSMIPAKYQVLFSVNPIVGVIEAFRWIFFENLIYFPYVSFMISLTISLLLLSLALYVFRKVERFFADVI